MQQFVLSQYRTSHERHALHMHGHFRAIFQFYPRKHISLLGWCLYSAYAQPTSSKNCTVFSVKMQLLYWTKSADRVEWHCNRVNWMNLTCVLFTLHITTYNFSVLFLCILVVVGDQFSFLCRICAVVIFIYLLLLAAIYPTFTFHISCCVVFITVFGITILPLFTSHHLATIGIYVLLCSRIVHCFDVLWSF